MNAALMCTGEVQGTSRGVAERGKHSAIRSPGPCDLTDPHRELASWGSSRCELWFDVNGGHSAGLPRPVASLLIRYRGVEGSPRSRDIRRMMRRRVLLGLLVLAGCPDDVVSTDDGTGTETSGGDGDGDGDGDGNPPQ